MANPQMKDNNVSIENPANGNEGFDDAPRRLPKSVKWLAGTAVGLVILAGAAGVIATQVIDQQKYKSLAIEKVKDATGYTIDWKGNINLGLMPLPHATVSELSVKAGSQDVLSIAKADVQVALASLLSGKIDIRNISLDQPVVTLVTSANGRETWVTDKLSSPAAAAENQAASDDSGTGDTKPVDIAVNKIEITDGKFIIDNRQSGSKQELKNLNLALRAESLSGPFNVDGDTIWSGHKVNVKATSGEVNSTEGTYPIQASLSVPDAGTALSFAGVVEPQNKSAKGDITVELDKLSGAIKSMAGTQPSLPDGLDGKATLAGKVVYAPNRVALDDIAVSVGKLAFAGQAAVEGLADGNTPQLVFDFKSTTKSAVDGDDIVRVLSDLDISARGSVENNKIQIASSHIKTLGNDISMSGFSGMGDNPVVDLNITASEINLDKLSGKKTGAENAGSTAAGGEKSSSGAKPSVSGFTVPFAGRVRADIAKLTTGGQTYSNINADVVSHDGALTISNASLNLPQSASVSISGKIANTSQLSGLDLKLDARTADAEKLMQSYNITPPDISQKIGAASVNGHFTGDLENMGFAATVSALQFSLGGTGAVAHPVDGPEISALKFTIRHPNFNDAMKTLQPGFAGSAGFYGPLDIAGQVAWNNDSYTVSGLTGKLGQTTISGQLTAATKPKMSLSGNLDLGNITLPSATTGGGAASSSSPAAAKSSAQSGGRWSRDPIDTGWMHAFNADLKIRAKSITQNMWKLTDANFAFNLKDGVLTLDDISAGLFGGTASINGVVKSGSAAKDPLSISAKMKANNVDAQGLMSAATGKVSHTLTGTLSDVDVSVNATGASPAALVQTLGGKGTINGKNIVVQGVDAAQLASTAKGSYKPLERAGSLFQTFQSGSTEFTDFNSAFDIANGIVGFSKIYFDGPKATLNSTGNVNLPAWTVDLKNTMTVKDTDIPPFDFSIRGPLDSPINSGGDIINNYLQNKLQKKATKLLEDKLGKFLGGGQSSGDAAPAATTGGATDATAPAATSTTPQPNAKQQAAEEAVKALQGLFGK